MSGTARNTEQAELENLGDQAGVDSSGSGDEVCVLHQTLKQQKNNTQKYLVLRKRKKILFS